MQNKEDVESPRQHRIRQILRLDHLPQHVHEVFGVAEVVVRIDVGKSINMAIRHGRNRGHLAHQPLDLQQPDRRVVNVLRFRIHARERRHAAHQHRHGVRVVAETFHELLGGFMEHGVVRDVMHPVLQFTGGRQFAEQKHVRHFKIGTVFGKNLDGITPVAQDSRVAVDVGDRAPAGRRVHESRVISHQAEIFRAGLDLAQIHRADGSVFNGKGVALAGTVVGDGYGVLRHPGSPENSGWTRYFTRSAAIPTMLPAADAKLRNPARRETGARTLNRGTLLQLTRQYSLRGCGS